MSTSAANRKARAEREAVRSRELRTVATGKTRWGAGRVHLALYDGDAWRAACATTQQPADVSQPPVSLAEAQEQVTCQKCRPILARLTPAPASS